MSKWTSLPQKINKTSNQMIMKFARVMERMWIISGLQIFTFMILTGMFYCCSVVGCCALYSFMFICVVVVISQIAWITQKHWVFNAKYNLWFSSVFNFYDIREHFSHLILSLSLFINSHNTKNKFSFLQTPFSQQTQYNMVLFFIRQLASHSTAVSSREEEIKSLHNRMTRQWGEYWVH